MSSSGETPSIAEPAGGGAPTLLQAMRRRAATDADRIAYTFLADGVADARSITWSQLNRRASVLGESLRRQGAAGEPVLLALPSGLGFVEWLFACWYAGAIAVPISLPRHLRVKHRLELIVADAGARFAVGDAATRQRIQADRTNADRSAALTWIAADVPDDSADTSTPPESQSDRVALLQYTSGSTGDPRGVIVTHENLMCNSALVAEACGHAPGQTIAGWLPLFHDMGLIGLVLQAAFSGARCVFMPPERFLMRPWLWLQMISDYDVCSSPAPNFAYDLCVDKVSAEQKSKLDLRCWRNALNGSEPVRALTLDRFATAFSSCGFRRAAFFPCYGLAEATLFVTGRAAGRPSTRRRRDGTLIAESDPRGYVSCGRAFGDTQIAIGDPQTAVRVPDGQVGEIWLAGNSIAQGYWNNPQATAATFNAVLEMPADADRSELKWLRTGDLGFVADGEVFITGRLREMIIIAGRNHFPVDIERSVESADPAIAVSGAVAFSVDVGGIERLIVAAEVRREYGRSAFAKTPQTLDAEAVGRRISAAVAAECEAIPYDVVLLRGGALPRTSSGKVRRLATRDAYLNGTLERFITAPHADRVL